MSTFGLFKTQQQRQLHDREQSCKIMEQVIAEHLKARPSLRPAGGDNAISNDPTPRQRRPRA